MANISGKWDKTKPAGTDPVSQGDDRMRSHWDALQDSWQEEHYFSASPTSAGIHKAGSARVFVGPLSDLSADGADDVGRLMYAVDDESLYILGDSATTKIAGAQQGGPVRSVVSATFGWYISSYTTGDHASDETHLWANASGNPMTFRDGSERLLGFSTSTTGPSATTDINVPIVWSVNSRGMKVQIANWSEDYGASAGAGTAAFGEQAAGSLIAHVSAIGLIPVSEMS